MITIPTADEIREWPVTVDLPTAGRAFGLHRAKSYELAKRGEFPCPTVKLGHRYKVTRAALLRALGIEDVTPVRR